MRLWICVRRFSRVQVQLTGDPHSSLVRMQGTKVFRMVTGECVQSGSSQCILVTQRVPHI